MFLSDTPIVEQQNVLINLTIELNSSSFLEFPFSEVENVNSFSAVNFANNETSDCQAVVLDKINGQTLFNISTACKFITLSDFELSKLEDSLSFVLYHFVGTDRLGLSLEGIDELGSPIGVVTLVYCLFNDVDMEEDSQRDLTDKSLEVADILPESSHFESKDDILDTEHDRIHNRTL